MPSLQSSIPRCRITHHTSFIFTKTLKSQKLKILFVFIVLLIFFYYMFMKNKSVNTELFSSIKYEHHNGHTGGSTSRILCYILLSQRLLPVAKIIQETWGSKCDKLIFFGRFQSSDVSVTFLNVSEGYAQLWGKTKAALIYLQNYTEQYDWFIKADSDTFVIMNNLRKFLANRNPHNPTWFGYKLKHSQLKEGYMSGGAGYTFSKDALNKIVSLLKSSFSERRTSRQLQQQCDIRGTRGYEDLELGKCFNHAGVKQINTVDTEGKERFLPVPLNTLLSGDLSNFHWIWQKAWNPPQIGPNCCSKELISMHQISPGGMRTLHFLLETIKQ